MVSGLAACAPADRVRAQSRSRPGPDSTVSALTLRMLAQEPREHLDLVRRLRTERGMPALARHHVPAAIGRHQRGDAEPGAGPEHDLARRARRQRRAQADARRPALSRGSAQAIASKSLTTRSCENPKRSRESPRRNRHVRLVSATSSPSIGPAIGERRPRAGARRSRRGSARPRSSRSATVSFSMISVCARAARRHRRAQTGCWCRRYRQGGRYSPALSSCGRETPVIG